MQDSPLNFNPEFLFKKSATELFITPETQEKTSEKCLNAISEVNASVEEGAYPFINVLKEQSYIEHTGAVFENIRWAQTMIVVGIGGSNLGALALKGIFEIQEAPMRVLFHGDSPDPVALDRLLEKISLEKTVFVIISKSGQTVETMVQYLYLKTLYQDNESWQKHFIFITDPVEGLLRLEATSHGISTLEIPSGVGGRFSVLTPVGFLPALAMGIAIEELRQGALDCIESENLKEIVAQFATTQFQLYEEGCKVVSCMPYATQLEEFSKWFRQLWAESLGKNGGGIP
ncbi:MAG: hypothetical protein WAU07_02615, partial [Microgenomates group bacterium]